MAGLYRATTTERILGADEKKRSTKTYITSEKAAIVLSLIKNHAENLARALRELRQLEDTNGHLAEQLSDEELESEYPGLRAWRDLHQQLVEHYASHGGFSLKVAARTMLLEQEQASKSESSIPTGEKPAK